MHCVSVNFLSGLFSTTAERILPTVADDILDVTATSEELGKTAGKDTDSNKTTETKKVDSREQEIKDSTKMLDKKLADPNSNYSPDSLK